MQQELAADYTKLEQLNTGPVPTARKRPKYDRLQSTLKSLCVEYTAGTKNTAQFLRAVGYNIRLRPM